jgi:KipI family sensor histidine kinase inhibitor
VNIRSASDSSLLVSFGNEISVEMHRNVLRLSLLLKVSPGILNIHPAYSSILVTFNPLHTDARELAQSIGRLFDRMDETPLPPPRLLEIPVCYGGPYGPDLSDVASLNHLTPEQVIAIHSSAEYLIYFLGFSPGFPYMGGLPPSIAAPRLPSPRKRVPAGSVAIGGSQTGIYSVSSPGGWRIIGRTSLKLFQPDRDPPTLLQMGDHVKFFPITKDQF